jgi:hypothetical protein
MIVVHGVGGKIIKAMTYQQLLVDAINKMTWCLQWVLQELEKRIQE